MSDETELRDEARKLYTWLGSGLIPFLDAHGHDSATAELRLRRLSEVLGESYHHHCRPEMGCGARRRSDRIREINDWSEQPATDIVAALALLCEEVEELGRRVRESTAATGRIE